MLTDPRISHVEFNRYIPIDKVVECVLKQYHFHYVAATTKFNRENHAAIELS